MTTSAKVICDSIYEGSRLTTMEVTFHRFVLAEFNTHRVFSRNSASSRAIPVEKQLAKIRENPAYPIEWPCEQPGMQGGTELSKNDEVAEFTSDWLDANYLFQCVKDSTVQFIEDYLALHPDKSTRLHKSLINRLLEPFMWHTVVVTSTEWDNFFEQRCSPLAQPEIRVAAEMMQAAYVSNEPTDLFGWHLPYVSEDEKQVYKDTALIKASVARCARVSTLNQDDLRPDIHKDLALFDKLISAEPPHWSPTEHVAVSKTWNSSQGNFSGSAWHQLRHNMRELK